MYKWDVSDARLNDAVVCDKERSIALIAHLLAPGVARITD